MNAREAQITDMLVECFRRGGKLLLCGNGGSAADVQHIAAEFLGRYKMDRAPLPAIVLGSDWATVTAIANDYGYHQVFARPLTALARSGDVLIALSTSGTSENVLNAIHAARLHGGVEVIMITGDAAPFTVLGGVHVRLTGDTAAVQEKTMALMHRVCGAVEQAMFGAGPA